MATYAELFGFFNESALRNKVAVAVIIAADKIRTETPPPNSALRLVWAKRAFENPMQEAESMLKVLLAANEAAAPSQITGASDTTIQTQVDAAVNVFAGS